MVRLTLALEKLLLTGASARTPYELHQLLWRGFPGVPEGTAQPFLYRADRLQDGGDDRLVVLLQPERAADWSALGDAVERNTTEKTFELDAGSRLRFLLRANPTVSRKGRHEPRTQALEGEAFRAARGRRVALLREEDRILWLERQGERHGFRIVRRTMQAGGESVERLALRVGNRRTLWWSREGRPNARHDGCDFEGVLEVVNPERFAAALRSGIGPGKAFGFGLLSVAHPEVLPTP